MIASSLLAAAIYLLPITAFCVLRSRRATSLWQSATDIPLAVALDLIVVLLLTRFMRLELAAVVSRVLWVVGLATWTTWRARRGDFPQWPAALDRQLLVNALSLALVGVLCSLPLSRDANIWDRDWHMPLVASLRGQQLPFMNVYEPRTELHYHFCGDVLAAMFQTLSRDALHSALALSLAHDVMFGLLGVVTSFTLAAVGIRRVALHLTVFAAILLSGPMTFAQHPKEPDGYSLSNLLSLSYRPHTSLAYLLTFGFAAALIGGVYRGRGDTRAAVFPVLVATAAVLAITDEITLVMLGLWIGVVWLLDPGCLADKRWRGASKLLILAAAIGASILVFGGTLGLHAPRYPMALIAPRAPSWVDAPEPLSTALGRSRVFEDMFSVFGVLVAAIAVAIRSAQRPTRTIAISFVVISLAATAALTCLDFNHHPVENHRWVTLTFLFAPLLGAFMLAEPELLGASRRSASLAGLVVYLSCGLGAASTVEWLWTGLGLELRSKPFGQGLDPDHLYELDCRSVTGAHFGERAVATYAEKSGVVLWSGCRPSFIPGPRTAGGGHSIKTGAPSSGTPALEDIVQNMLKPANALRVACSSDGSTPDDVCAAAQTSGVAACKPEGTSYTLCMVASEHRGELSTRPKRIRH